MSPLKKFWRAWRRYWSPAYEPPRAGDVMLKRNGKWEPATEAERAELLRLLTMDLES